MTPQELKNHLEDRSTWRINSDLRESDRYLLERSLNYINRLECQLESLRNRYIESRNP